MRLISLITASCITLPLATVVAGDDVKTEHPAKQAHHFKALSDILGSDVRMQASAEEREEAREDGEVAKGPKASIEDLVLRTRDGQIESAVLNFGGFIGIGDKTVVLPVSRLTWDENEKIFRVNATEAQLKGLPDFDLSDARDKTFDADYTTVCKSWSAVGFPKENDMANNRDASKMPRTDGSAVKRGEGSKMAQAPVDHAAILRGTTCTVIPTQYILASKIEDLDVSTLEGDETGSISKCIVNCSNRTLEYAVIDGLADAEYVLPMESLIFCQKDEEPCLCFVHPVTSLSTAVEYKEPESGVLSTTDADAAKHWCESQPKSHKSGRTGYSG